MKWIISLVTAGVVVCSPVAVHAQEATVEARADVVSVDTVVTMTTTRETDFGRVILPQSAGRTCRYLLGSRVARSIRTVSSIQNQATSVDSGLTGSSASPECVFLDTPTRGLVDVACGPLDEISIRLAFETDANARAAGLSFQQDPISGRTATIRCTDGSARLYVGGVLNLTGGASTPYSGPIANTTITLNF